MRSRFNTVLRFAIAVLTLALASCATDPSNHKDTVLLSPIKDVGVAVVGLGAALNLRSKKGAPEIRSLDKDYTSENKLTWIGHSSFLLRLGQSSILLDPIFSEHPQLPIPIRPKRVTALPLTSDTITRLDAVVISHDDYDHFDMPTLKQLSARFPEAILFVPKGTTKLAAKTGFKRIVDLDQYESKEVDGITYTALPAYHFGRRDMVGISRTLALGWEIKSRGHKLFFSGDTGYGPAFKEIRKRRGPYDTALVAIGAFKPAFLFNDIHTTPEQAIKIASDLDAPIAIPHHWGTFIFGVEEPGEASSRFLKAATDKVTARVLAIGETISLR